MYEYEAPPSRRLVIAIEEKEFPDEDQVCMKGFVLTKQDSWTEPKKPFALGYSMLVCNVTQDDDCGFIAAEYHLD